MCVHLLFQILCLIKWHIFEIFRMLGRAFLVQLRGVYVWSVYTPQSIIQRFAAPPTSFIIITALYIIIVCFLYIFSTFLIIVF